MKKQELISLISSLSLNGSANKQNGIIEPILLFRLVHAFIGCSN